MKPAEKKYPTMLSVAGSDNTGGAGIQADLKTAMALGVYAATIITGVTSQNSFGVADVTLSGARSLRSQFSTLFRVMTPDAVKTGMIPDPETAAIVAYELKQRSKAPLVVDPVLYTTAGGSLATDPKETSIIIRKQLTPLAQLVTPNIPEASYYIGDDISKENPEEVCRALKDIFGSRAVLLKGGHSDKSDKCLDFFWDGVDLIVFESEKIISKNLHGTGCVLSSAIASFLALGMKLPKAVANAKRFISEAIARSVEYDVIVGHGPLDLSLTCKD